MKTKFICMSALEKEDTAPFETECHYNITSNTFEINQSVGFESMTLRWMELTMDEAKEIAKMIMEYIGEDYEQIAEN